MIKEPITKLNFSVQNNKYRRVLDVRKAGLSFHKDYIDIQWDFDFRSIPFSPEEDDIDAMIQRSLKNVETKDEDDIVILYEERRLYRGAIRDVALHNLDSDTNDANFAVRINDCSELHFEYNTYKDAQAARDAIHDWAVDIEEFETKYKKVKTDNEF